MTCPCHSAKEALGDALPSSHMPAQCFHQLLSHWLISLLNTLITWNHTPNSLHLDYNLESLATLPRSLDESPLYINVCLNEVWIHHDLSTVSISTWLLLLLSTHIHNPPSISVLCAQCCWEVKAYSPIQPAQCIIPLKMNYTAPHHA